ncbi:MAG: hypothetical protein RIT04_253 [Candidatus Parcubacteria bacterium]|jgi:hypothetical protein
MSEKKMPQDMVPNNRRSIRDIKVKLTPMDEKPLPRAKVTVKPPPEVRAARRASSSTASGSVSKKRHESNRTKMVLMFGILILCIGIILAAISLIFSSGTVVVKPKVISLAVNTSVSARPNAANTSGGLSYEVITATKDMYATIPSVPGPAILKKATGTVTLYNKYSATPQKIVAGTRLSNTKGLIYRTQTAVTIPAMRGTGSKAVAGSVDVKVIADQAGANYNATLTDLTGDFKIVAYKGTTKYTTIFARSKTDLVGGYSGVSTVPDKTALATTQKGLSQTLKAQLLADSKTLIPKGYVSYNAADQISYTMIDPVAKGTSSASVGVKATYSTYIFKSVDLVNTFAKDQVAQFPSGGFTIEGLDALNVQIASSTAAAGLSASSSKPISFGLKGDIRLVGIVPVDKLKQELVGIALSDTAGVIKRYSTIASAYAKISPVWMRSMPDSPERITVEIQSE